MPWRLVPPCIFDTPITLLASGCQKPTMFSPSNAWSHMKIKSSHQKSMIFLVVALVDSKMLTNNIVLQKCTFHRFTGHPDVYVQNKIPSICALTTCRKMLRSYSTLSGLALMTQDSSREGRGLHRDSLKSSHMARAWSQILQLVCDYSNACKLHKLANMHFPEALLRVPRACW